MAAVVGMSHRSSSSMDMSAATPTTKQQRRMTSPAIGLVPPEGVTRPAGARPPSPLRNGFTPNSATGIDPEVASEDGEDAEWLQRSPSPASSVSQFAANFVQQAKQQVNQFVGGMAQSPRVMPTDAELEADAQAERDRSRREAERILHQEAAERRLMEDRVFAMIESSKSLPPPPSRSASMPNPPSPSGSQKDGVSWWAAAKNKLTPTKDSLTPAQQLVQDMKVKEKQEKKSAVKGKNREDWPANPQSKYADPSFHNLVPPPQRRAVPATPPSPSPRQVKSNMQVNMTPSPMRSAADSPSRGEGAPLYAQFDHQGALDVPGTLLTIAKRFEKLEKWTVGHVRALEERMSDVERWLVDKEKEREEREGQAAVSEQGGKSKGHSDEDFREIRDEVAELQGRVGELGREMANIASKNLSSGPSRRSAQVEELPDPVSDFIIHSQRASINDAGGLPTTPDKRFSPATARDSTSPPVSSVHRRSSTGTKFPYPTGDYATPPDSNIKQQSTPPDASPSTAPGLNSTRPLSIPGLPSSPGNVGLGIGVSHGPPSASTSYSTASFSTASSFESLSNLPPPKMPSSTSSRQSSVSPTPRKRYTVALGGPISNPSERLRSPPPQGKYAAGTLTHSPGAAEKELDNDEDEEEFPEETIGKSAAARLANKSNGSTTSDSPRVRAQSAYGFSSLVPPTSPIKPKVRSQSNERFGASTESLSSVSSSSSKFVDPLVARRRERQDTVDKKKASIPKVEREKVPVGKLVAFFEK